MLACRIESGEMPLMLEHMYALAIALPSDQGTSARLLSKLVRLPSGLRRALICMLALFAAGSTYAVARPASDLPSVAFYYGPNPPLADLRAFDIAVVEPAFVPDPKRHARSPAEGTHELFAYVSLGEVQPTRPYYGELPAGAIRTDNPAWGSRVIDQASPGWQDFFLHRIITPLWEQGYRGFFIDTLDSYQLFAKTDAERETQTAAMIRTLQAIKQRYPQARLILNRGFELLPVIAPLTFAVAAESLYQGYDASKGLYRPVSDADRAWLLGQLDTARHQYGLPVIAIDYVQPGEQGTRALALDAAAKIRAHGYIPWVADGSLMSIGVGAIEAIPRNVLLLVDTGGGGALDVNDAQLYLGMPLNYLGLRYEFLDLSKDPLPNDILVGRYAGIVSWLPTGSSYAELPRWLNRQIAAGMRIAVFHSFGFAIDAASARWLGLQPVPMGRPEKLAVHASDQNFIGHEFQPLPDRNQITPVRLAEGAGTSLLRTGDHRGNTYDAVALTQWGGYALSPYTINVAPRSREVRWILHPINFLKAALKLSDLPVPDVTTEAGRRMLMIHIDGDGFASRAEMPASPFAADILRKEFLERYQFPTTMSIIEGEIGARGRYPHLTKHLEPIARKIFALPHVEAASHTFSHPFIWSAAMQAEKAGATEDRKGKPNNHLDLPDYRFNLPREISGSVEYMSRQLMPAGKAVKVLLWTGDCIIPAEGIAETYRHGLLNMNGGDTIITERDKSLTNVSAHGIRKSGSYQVYAPNQNENLYTKNWTGPFYGYEKVIETFRLTGEPLRLKPVNIYYHTYSASKPASITALHKVYRWATAQPLTPVYGSEYIRKVLDFEATTIARDLATGDLLIRTGGDLRTLRLAPGAAEPSLSASSGIAGIAPGPAGAYLTMAAPHARLTKADGRRVPHIVEASGAISDMARESNGRYTDLRFTLTSSGPSASLVLGDAAGCAVSINGSRSVPQNHATVASAPSKTTTLRTGSQTDSASQYYDLGPNQQSVPATKRLALVRCPV